MENLIAIAWAVGLLVAAIAVLGLELLLPSYGLLGLLALGLAIGSIVAAFSASIMIGWIFLIGVPIIGVVIISRGLKHFQKSRWVPQDEITADAGYHHVATALGIRVGAEGTLVTDALPTGRARFARGELDVQAAFGSLDKGRKVRVTRFDGAIIFVEGIPTGSLPT